jgi:hypothetical protein
MERDEERPSPETGAPATRVPARDDSVPPSGTDGARFRGARDTNSVGVETHPAKDPRSLGGSGAVSDTTTDLPHPASRRGTADPLSIASPDVRLSPRRVVVSSRCRCGTALRPNDLAIALDGMPDLVLPLFEGKLFCQYRCIRAEFLELLETLDGMVEGSGEEIVLDLRPTYARLAREYASLLHE